MLASLYSRIRQSKVDKPAGAACLQCPLRDAPCVPSELRKSAPVAIVGEHPGNDEVSDGRPLVGRSGPFLGQQLAKLGVKRTDCSVTNAVLCHSTDKDKLREAAKHCKRRLHEELAAANPRSIIALGGVAVKSLLKPRKAGILDWRGAIASIRWERDGKGVLHAYDTTQESAKGKLVGSYVFPIMHPGFVSRAPEYDDVFKLDLSRAVRYLHRDWLAPEYEVGRTLITCKNDVDALELLSEEVVAADVETNEANSAMQARLSCMVFADRKTSVVVPWTTDVNGFNPWWKNPQQIAAKIEAKIKKHTIVGHNLAYDIPVFHVHGMNFDRFEDTILMQHAIASYMPKNLRYVAAMYLDVPQWKQYDNRGDISLLHAYNHRDGCYNIDLWHEMKDDLHG